MATGSISQSPAAVLAGLAIAAAAGVAISSGFGVRQDVFNSIGFQEARFVLIIPSQVCTVIGALAAGRLASTRPIRGLAVIATALTAGFVFVAEVARADGANLQTGIALACAFSGIGSALIVLAAIALVQTMDTGRAFAVSLALALVFGMPAGMRYFEFEMNTTQAPYLALGACAAIMLIWAPSSVPVTQNRLAFAPVGPAPISVRATPSQTPVLALIVAALSVAGWATFMAPQIQSGFAESTDLYSMAIVVALGLAASALGETAAVRLAALLIAGALAWTLAGGPGWPGPLAGNFSFSLADFVAIVVASRYGQPGETAMRIGALMALGTIVYIPLNLIAMNLENRSGFFDEFSTWQLSVAIIAGAAALLMLLRLPSARTPAAAW